ncbi:hypothetical protein HPQ64_08000 [Rhizobiales bacterium]|uniref:hypothetical protein n=1 Tax=Hongsoonwoonella zoysiae TaxID=2821844 RepID=UPI001561011A|nr:hypothetical protein [Hongsoonwoonella zoysiae]NRG17627.1 hypothetical protein [Hongsoonwoonella zoysiae]
MFMKLPSELEFRHDLPDVDIRHLRDLQPLEPREKRLKRVVALAGTSILAVTFIALLIFAPVLLSEMARVDEFVTAAGAETASVFVDRLAGLFIGALVIAVAIVSFGLTFLVSPFEPRFLSSLDYADIEGLEDEAERKASRLLRRMHDVRSL